MLIPCILNVNLYHHKEESKRFLFSSPASVCFLASFTCTFIFHLLLMAMVSLSLLCIEHLNLSPTHCNKVCYLAVRLDYTVRSSKNISFTHYSIFRSCLGAYFDYNFLWKALFDHFALLLQFPDFLKKVWKAA